MIPINFIIFCQKTPTSRCVRAQPKQDGKQLQDAKNYQKQRIKVAKIYAHIKDCRTDYLHKISTAIIKNHAVTGIEDLQVASLVKNHQLAEAISAGGISSK